MGKEPLSREEYDEAVEAYTDEYKNSSGSFTAELSFRVSLKRIGMDEDEISYLVRTTHRG